MAELAYSSWGDRTKPALLLVHGFMSSNAQWLANREALGEHFHLVMTELWGHGASPIPENPEDFSVAAYIREFERIREHLDISRWGVIGQSYGAGLVINYALEMPERCVAVVVTNSRSALGKLTAPEGPRRRAQGSSERSLRELPFHPIHARRFPPHVKEALVADADRILPAAVEGGGRLGRDLNCIEKLRELTQPILLTNGVFEASFQQDVASLRSRHPDLEVADLDGGHSVNIEAAAAFEAAVLNFLKLHFD